MAQDTRTRMIETTARLLQHRGYHGTALSDILAESSAPRGSLYFHFPGGKDQLVIEATRGAIEEATQALRDALAKARTPAQGVRAYAEAAAHIMQESDYTFGCPVAPVILDAAAGLAELAALCRQAFEEWTALLRASFIEAGVPSRRAQTLAVFVVSAIEGALVMARGYRDCGPLTTVAAELETVVAAALPRRRRV
ncbi:MAG TPA: TetR/AcrR family transcriptional regulator, partial [Dongiaceae bacterium]|nr:TetR/AcrR family transcriptional regulator [Dongiaceae bacterium]